MTKENRSYPDQLKSMSVGDLHKELIDKVKNELHPLGYQELDFGLLVF